MAIIGQAITPNMAILVIMGIMARPIKGWDTAQNSKKKDGLRVGGGWVGGLLKKIMPRCGSILQTGTCQILSIAENPRWSRVWQKTKV